MFLEYSFNNKIYFNKNIKIEYVPILGKETGIGLAKEIDRIYCPSFIVAQKKYYRTGLLKNNIDYLLRKILITF